MGLPKVRKGIPIRAKGAVKSNVGYGWGRLDIGDSLAIPARDTKEAHKVQSAASHYCTRHNMVFISRFIRDEQIILVWRIQ